MGTGIALLADPTRRRIIGLLALHPTTPSVIAREIGRSRPATSRQLRLLEEAGLIRPMGFQVDARSVLYVIQPAERGRITAWLAGTDVGRPTTSWPGAFASPEPPEHDAPGDEPQEPRITGFSTR